MWLLFKLINFFWLLASTYMWPTALMSMGPILILVNIVMIVSLSFLPVQVKLDAKFGLSVLALFAIVLWYMACDGAVMGFVILLQYLPVLFLIQLPSSLLYDLLRFCTKWLAILLIPGLLIYWVTLVADLPSIGRYVHPLYEPYTNYLFFIKTTYDYGTLVRFNSVFLEPGHMGLLCTFMMMANGFRFKECKWLYVLAVSVGFSFSLAAYLLSVIGFIALKINSLVKLVAVAVLIAGVVVGALTLGGGDNAMNELIISRLEYDDSKGIKGNNRVESNVDYVYEKSIKDGNHWVGVQDKTNMDMVAGAGVKIFVIHYGFVAVILVFLFYISLIPTGPDWRYTMSFLLVLALCFLQRAYPEWYSWLFPYVAGIYIEKSRKLKKIEYET